MKNFFIGFKDYLHNWLEALTVSGIFLALGVVVTIFSIWDGINGKGPEWLLSPKMIDLLKNSAEELEQKRLKKLEKEINNSVMEEN